MVFERVVQNDYVELLKPVDTINLHVLGTKSPKSFFRIRTAFDREFFENSPKSWASKFGVIGP